jgi:hypothetical protein
MRELLAKLEATLDVSWALGQLIVAHADPAALNWPAFVPRARAALMALQRAGVEDANALSAARTLQHLIAAHEAGA